MTSLLRLNGIVVPVSPGTNPSADRGFIGKKERASDLSMVASELGEKGRWTVTTPPLVAATALAFRDLVMGKGHVLNFDASSYYTCKGMAPVSIGAGWGFSGSAKYGAKAILSPGSGAAAVWQFFSASSPWSIFYWANLGTGYHHVVLRSDTSSFIDGVFGGAFPVGWTSGHPGLTVSAGAASFASTGGGTWLFDDVVALPYLVPDDWPLQVFNFGQPFGQLPNLTADGLLIERNTMVSVQGDEPKGRVIRIAGSSDASKSMHSFSFGFDEV